MPGERCGAVSTGCEQDKAERMEGMECSRQKDAYIRANLS